MSRLIAMIVGTAVVLGLAIGCGSGDDGGESTALTKAQFIKQADAICAERTKERADGIAAQEKEASKGTEEFDLNASLKEIGAPSLRREAEELKALAPPEEDEAEVAQMAESLLRVSKAFEDEDSEGVSQNLLAFEREATAYGFKVCAPEN